MANLTVSRRRLVALAGAVATVGFPAIASARGLPRMTDGPFYPPLAYRARSVDWDADLTTVRGRAPDGQPLPRARGEFLDLRGAVVDGDGHAIDGAEVEIWQCDAFGSYRHPRGAGDRVDAGFQGFGSTRSDAGGRYRFLTIRPVPYPGRTPHIHVKLRHPGFGELTSQLFVAGELGNAGDVLYRGLDDAERKEVELRLQRPAAGEPVAWLAERDLIVSR
ncbi:MAG TPA: intradiol ring-cleavage dioxygenase [Caldimonas sp.]|nr:intradiol ring-cleavage dioxygenase [Caldimonas sp.]HEX4233450.1 intradiol ring-cleavage dioxygenase [Caldimonas sp.]